MKQPKVFVLRTAGTNCDIETAHAFQKVGAQTTPIHINQWLKNKSLIHQFHILALPGGFSYGDDIGAGVILAAEMRYHLTEDIIKFIRAGNLVLGICNGFQVLVRLGLLPGLVLKQIMKDKKPVVSKETPINLVPESTLTGNDSGHYDDRWVYLKKVSKRCVFTKNWDRPIVYLPVAHAEGKFIPENSKVLQQLKANDQIVFQYVDELGRLTNKYPANPNGSTAGIAGICDPTGRVLGMMPHPERYSEIYNHPRWTREKLKDPTDGMLIFQNAVSYVKSTLL
jgi:phosphoribosylformylglycinamidine synthase subunit PurQ / glutaminase